jgi:hemoglobin-like flavoprotein
LIVQLSDETIGLVRESAALLPVGDATPVRAFYRRLFELAPGLRGLFHVDIDLQAQKLADMLAWVVTHLDERETLATTLRALGARHVEYGVVVDQYAPVGSALVWMFTETLGDRFTPAMEEAWIDTFAAISSEMERGARAATAGPSRLAND